MPYCKNCHSRIDKFNKDRCPICGYERPLDDVSSDTVEITTSIDVNDLNLEYHPRLRNKMFIYFITLGIFGVPFFYLYRKKAGIIYAVINLILLGGIIALLATLTEMHIALVIVLALLSLIVINSCIGLYFYKKPNLKDGHGDFLE